MVFTQREARAIAVKLQAEIKTGKKHDQAIIRYGSHVVARYGIRRGSQAAGHDYIPRQLYVSRQQALDLVQCPLDRDGYFAILREHGRLSEENHTQPEKSQKNS